MLRISELNELFILFHLRVISGFHREVHENCALLGHYAASSDNFLPTFRDNLSVQSSGITNSYSYCTCIFLLFSFLRQQFLQFRSLTGGK